MSKAAETSIRNVFFESHTDGTCKPSVLTAAQTPATTERLRSCKDMLAALAPLAPLAALVFAFV